MKNALEIQDVESLELRFPQMFAGPVIGLEFYKGWFPDFVRLCFEVDALLGDERHRFHWDQLKEKFGGYRMHFIFRFRPLQPGSINDYDEPDEDEEIAESKKLTAIRDQIRSTIEDCAATMFSKCCICGDPGTSTGYGWLRVLCSYHGDAARLERGDQRPFSELTAVPRWPGDEKSGVASS